MRTFFSLAVSLSLAAPVFAGPEGGKSEEAARNELLEFYKAAQDNVLAAQKTAEDGMKKAEEWTQAYSDYAPQFDGMVQKLGDAVLRNRQTAQDKLEVINFLQRLEGSKVYAVSQYRLNEKINRMDNYAEIIGELQRVKQELDGRYSKAVAWAGRMAEEHKGLGELAQAIAGKAGLLRHMKISIEIMEKYKPVPDDKFDSLRQIETMLGDVTKIVPRPMSDVLDGYAKTLAGITSALRALDTQIQNNARQGFMEITGPEQRAWQEQYPGEFAGVQKMKEFPEVEPQGLWVGTALDGEIYAFEDGRFSRLSCSAGALRTVYGHYTELLEKVRALAGAQVKIPLGRLRRACEDPDFVARLQNASGLYDKARDPQNYPGSFASFTSILSDAFGATVADRTAQAIRSGPAHPAVTPPGPAAPAGGDPAAYLLWADALWRRYDQLASEADLGDKFAVIKADAKTASQAFAKNYNSTLASKDPAYGKANKLLWLLCSPERWETGNPKAEMSAQNAAALLGVDAKATLRLAGLAKGNYRGQLENYGKALADYLEIKRQIGEMTLQGAAGIPYNRYDGTFYVAPRSFPKVPEPGENPLVEKLALLRDFLQGKQGGSNWTETVMDSGGARGYAAAYDDRTMDMLLSGEEGKAKKAAEALKWESPAPGLKAALLRVRAAADGVLKWETAQRFTLSSISPQGLMDRIDKDIACLDERDSAIQNGIREYKGQFPARVSGLAAECRAALATITSASLALCADTLKELRKRDEAEKRFYSVWEALNPSFKAMLRGENWVYRVPAGIPMGKSYEAVLEMSSFARQTAQQTVRARLAYASALEKDRRAARELPLFFLPQASSNDRGMLDAYNALVSDAEYRYGDEIAGAEPYEFEKTALQAALRALPQLPGRPGGALPGTGGGAGPGGTPSADEEIKRFYDRFAKAYESADLAGVLGAVSDRWRSNTGQTIAGLDGRLGSVFSTYKNLRCTISRLTTAPAAGGKQAWEVSYHIVIEGELVQRRGIVNREEYDVRETVELENGRLRITRTEGEGLLGE
ncbi:MAG: hypothetical protein M0011_01970 [Elusimicrobia bacterium]|nr:hypothetical protein [Elusimicrobiota bacterium]